MKNSRIISYLIGLLGLTTLGAQSALAQSTVTGTYTVFDGPTGAIHAISGQITLPNGLQYDGPVVITPMEQSITPPFLDGLIINPGGVSANPLPTGAIEEAANRLNDATTLDEQVSIIRQGSGFLQSAQGQASAMGSTTIVIDGSIQTVTGEVTLPNGLFYQGTVSPIRPSNNLEYDETCFGSGLGQLGTGACLVVTPFIDDLTLAPSYRIEKLVVNTGNPSVFPLVPGYNFNVVASTIVSGMTDLSERVSIIRAGSGSNGPFSSQIQAKATGSVVISMPNGSTQSVSGEVSLPPGMYFDNSLTTSSPDQSCLPSLVIGTCLTIQPDIQWANPLATEPWDTAYVNDLVIDPGQIYPQFALGISGLAPLDFNSATAFVLYGAIDTGEPLDHLVSLIRAGAGSNGLSSSDAVQAIATGSVTITVPNGSIQTVSGEISLPPGQYFQGQNTDPACASGGGCLVITPTLVNIYDESTVLDPNLVTIQSLKVDPGPSNSTGVIWTLDGAAAYALSIQTNLSDQVSIIRAASGVNGLD